MTQPIEISIIIPAYNEADNIMPVLKDTIATLDESPLAGRYELLLIDDGSTDGSRAVADGAGQQFARLRVFHHERNEGLGEGLKTGYRNSRGTYVTFLPADGEVKADQVLRLYGDLDRADMMTSSRLGYLDGSVIRKRGLFRGVLSWGFRLCIRVILGANPEKLTGIYIVRGDIVRALPLHARTALVSLEIYLHCLYSGCKMKHGATTICPRLSGVSKIANASGIWKSFWEMIQLRRQIRQQIRQQAPQVADTLKGAA
jgi:glycosyltransferase involved in cell wall biosynthesis